MLVDLVVYSPAGDRVAGRRADLASAADLRTAFRGLAAQHPGASEVAGYVGGRTCTWFVVTALDAGRLWAHLATDPGASSQAGQDAPRQAGEPPWDR
jgi:hypothetical protein